MSANLGAHSVPDFRETLGYLRAAFGFCTATEIEAVYRGVAESCIERQVTRALIIVGDDHAAGERALRDAATMMVLAGVAPGLRLALVGTAPRVMHTYRNAQRDLTAAGVNTRLFETEDAAVRWLQGPSGAALESEQD